MSPGQVKEELGKVDPMLKEEIMTLDNPFVVWGLEQGIQKGRQEGRQEGWIRPSCLSTSRLSCPIDHRNRLFTSVQLTTFHQASM